MYRKIIFIGINLFPINNFAKVTLLLLIALIASLMMFFLRPFIFNELNKIECYSLLSAIITLFSGALYRCDVSDELKAISFTTIILVNTLFCVRWLMSLLGIVFQTNMDKLRRIFPRFTYFIMACFLSLKTTKKSFKVVSYMKNMRMNYSRFKVSVKTSFESKNKNNSDMELSKIIQDFQTTNKNSKIKTLPVCKLHL